MFILKKEEYFKTALYYTLFL